VDTVDERRNDRPVMSPHFLFGIAGPRTEGRLSRVDRPVPVVGVTSHES
jgi:hypothetical protein